MEAAKKLKVFFEASLDESPVALDWSSCGRWLAVMDVNSSVLLFDTELGKAHDPWLAQEVGGLALAWHPSLPMFATSFEDGVVKLWVIDDTLSVSERTETKLEKNTGSSWIEFLKWRPDGRQLAAGIGDSVKLLSNDGNVESSFRFSGGTVADIAWHPKGSLLGISGYGGIIIYNASDPKGKPISLKRKGSILSLSWSPDGKYIVAGCQDNAVHLWRFRTRDDAQMSGFSYKPLQLNWCDRGKKLLTGGTSDLVIWPFDKKGPEGRAPETRPFHDEAICALDVKPKGNGIASGCRAGRIAIWESSRALEPKTWAGLGSRVEHLRWSPAKGSKMVAASGREGLLKIFDAAD